MLLLLLLRLNLFILFKVCFMVVDERLSEKIKILFFFLAQFTKKKKSPNAPWIQSSELSLSCQLILREGEERQLGLVYTWSLCVLSDQKSILAT